MTNEKISILTIKLRIQKTGSPFKMPQSNTTTLGQPSLSLLKPNGDSMLRSPLVYAMQIPERKLHTKGAFAFG